ncbi:acylphosphatase, partial [Candidatus Microgenomates bacterium]|nr:acylphosphatase [Candidatus Microgenomates bacterium]
EKENLQKLIAWVRVGPPSAHVTNCETEWQEATGEFQKFSVA